MAIHLPAHAFAANPLRGLSASSAVSPSAAADALRSLLDPGAGADAASPHPHISKIIPFRRGRPLALFQDASPPPPDAAPAWRLAWLPPSHVPGVPSDSFVFLGAHGEREGKEAAAYWAVDVAEDGSAFVDLRTLMVATDWSDKDAMGELAIAGHVRAVLQLLAVLTHLQFSVIFRGSRPGTQRNLIFASDASRLEHCWNGTARQTSVGRVGQRLFLAKLEGESSAATSRAKRGYILELIQYVTCSLPHLCSVTDKIHCASHCHGIIL
jgi:hypothetical protein